MKIVVLSGSPHKHGTTSKLVDSFIAGAEAAGHEVVRFDTAFMKIHPCIACEKCHTEYGKCVFEDDMVQIGKSLANSDCVVLATPIYYYEMSGQLKTFLDRCNPLYPQENKFKDVYLITSAYDSSEKAADRAINGLKGWIECFEQSRFAGALVGGGVDAPKSAANREDLLKKAYELGKNI